MDNESNLLIKLGMQSLATLEGKNFKVNRIISNGRCGCDNLPHTKNPYIDVNNVKIYDDGNEDHWYCKNTKNGEFQFKLARENLKGSYPSVIWATITWEKINNPKMSVCTYSLLTEKLSTVDNLRLMHIIIYNISVLCNQDEATIKNQFF